MNVAAASAPRFAFQVAAAVMAYAVIGGVLRIASADSRPAAAAGLVLLCVAFLLAHVRATGTGARVRAVLAGVVALTGMGAEVVAHGGALEVPEVWATSAVTCVALLLIWRGQHIVAWSTMAGLCALLLAVGGVDQVEELGVLTTVLALGVIAAAGRVLGWYAQQLQQYAGSEREALEWRIAQDAYQLAHQQRIEQTGALASEMLQRIVADDGRLDQEHRRECRVLHQAIRDETRGRLLLNDAVREQVRGHRRRGAVVQLLDDGHLARLTPAALTALQDEIAEKIAPLRSDRIVIRSGSQQGSDDQRVSIVATTVDPIAAALGQDDDETVDLWFEFSLPPVPVPVPVGR